MLPQGMPVSIQVARCSEGLLSSQGRKIETQLKGESRGLSRVAAGNVAFLRVSTVTSGSFSWCLWKYGILASCEGPLGIPLGSVQRKRASSRAVAGTSEFLSCSDVDLKTCVCSFKQGVRSQLLWRHGALFSSQVVKEVAGLQFSSIGFLWLFSNLQLGSQSSLHVVS